SSSRTAAWASPPRRSTACSSASSGCRRKPCAPRTGSVSGSRSCATSRARTAAACAPRATARARAAASSSRSPALWANARILLVEDEAPLARGLAFILEAEGYRVETTERGESALERLADPEGEEVDLVVLDVMLPGISGFDVVRRLRAA